MWGRRKRKKRKDSQPYSKQRRQDTDNTTTEKRIDENSRVGGIVLLIMPEIKEFVFETGYTL